VKNIFMTKVISTNLTLLPNSLTGRDGYEFGMAKLDNGNRLVVHTNSTSAYFNSERSEFGDQTMSLCRLSPQNAASLHAHLP
jgi:hypothetical protein